METIVWLIVVGVAGFVATLLTGTDSKYGVLANVIIGVIGAVVGGLIAGLLGLNSGGGLLLTFLIALAGAYLSLVVFEKAVRR